jgi:tRNA dimethylallyltransferase
MIRALVLGGPTAVGKSRIAVEVARRIDGEIVSADSRQVYRHMRVGTARPDAAEMGGVPHHLLGFLDPGEPYSAGRFAREAFAVIREIRGRGRAPVICGGTGLYIGALVDGLSEEPTAGKDPRALEAIRLSLEAELEREGPEALHRRLREVDPESAERIAPADVRRILRALEVYEATGVPLSRHHRERPGTPRVDALRFRLTMPREALYERIDRRVEEMFDAGWVGEVERLVAAGFGDGTPAFESLGYDAILRHIRDGIDREETVRTIQRATRRYAKRQMTWFRNRPGYRPIRVGPGCVDEIVAAWREFEGGGGSGL